MGKVHELKTWPQYFSQSWIGLKKFEIRENDRDYQYGDEIVLKEFDPSKKIYSGREIYGEITYVTSFHQQNNFIVFGFHESGRKLNTGTEVNQLKREVDFHNRPYHKGCCHE